MIEQTTFSQLIKDFLAKQFPDFLPSIKSFPDNSFECSLRSPSDSFSIYISTENSEITIGIIDPNGDSGIHTHVSCYDLEDMEDCLDSLSKIIKDIQEGHLILYKDEKGKYDWYNSWELSSLKGGQQIYWNK